MRVRVCVFALYESVCVCFVVHVRVCCGRFCVCMCVCVCMTIISPKLIRPLTRVCVCVLVRASVCVFMFECV